MNKPVSTAAEAEKQADEARRQLTATLDQLKDNLTPSHLAGEALAATRARTPEWLLRYWEFASSPAGLGLIGATAASISVTALKRRQRDARLRAQRAAAETQRRAENAVEPVLDELHERLHDLNEYVTR